MNLEKRKWSGLPRAIGSGHGQVSGWPVPWFKDAGSLTLTLMCLVLLFWGLKCEGHGAPVTLWVRIGMGTGTGAGQGLHRRSREC